MQIGNHHHNYVWTEKWGSIPDTQSSREGWAHHGIVVSKTGKVFSFHEGDNTLITFDKNGTLIDSAETIVENAHGMTLVEENGEEFIWLADNLSGQVVKVDLSGKLVSSISMPDIEVYADGGKYSPTDVAVNEERNGGNGEIVITDGYGSSWIHFYDRDGNLQASIDGTDGDGGGFATPHGVWIDNRRDKSELYIADRSNGQIQVYGLDGKFIRHFGAAPGADWLHSPSGFAAWGEYLIVAELRGSRVTLLDSNDEPTVYLGENTGAFKFNEGWPNVPHETLVPGKFNSPHGIAADSEGNIFVAEWLIGRRVNKLTRSG